MGVSYTGSMSASRAEEGGSIPSMPIPKYL